MSEFEITELGQVREQEDMLARVEARGQRQARRQARRDGRGRARHSRPLTGLGVLDTGTSLP